MNDPGDEERIAELARQAWQWPGRLVTSTDTPREPDPLIVASAPRPRRRLWDRLLHGGGR